MYKTLKEIQEALPDKDLYEYANKAEGKTAEEVIEIFKKDNIEISLDAAKECVECIKGIEVLSKNELSSVTGGCGSKPNPKYHVNQRIKIYYNITQNYRYFIILSIGEYSSDRQSYLYTVREEKSGRETSRYLDSLDNVFPA